METTQIEDIKNNSKPELIKKPQSHDIPNNWKERFLKVYEETGNKTYSAVHAGITVRTVHNHIHSDSEFATEVELAKQKAIMILHQIAWQRAVGTPIIDEETGDVTGHTPVSDKMIIFLLSSMSPDDYGHGAIRAAERKDMVLPDGGVQIIINLPENYRGEFTIGSKDAFPDASTIFDAEFSEEDTPSDLRVLDPISGDMGNSEDTIVEQSLDT